MKKEEFEFSLKEYDKTFEERIKYIRILRIDEQTLNDKGKLKQHQLEDDYNHEFFSEIYLNCSRMSNLGDELNSVKYLNPETNEVFSVEDLSLHYYVSKKKYSGIHSENGLGKTLFGLFLWDIIFDDTIPGVFQTPYQNGPLDYGSKEFYYRREDKILKRLEEISQMNDKDIETQINTLWDAHHKTYN